MKRYVRILRVGGVLLLGSGLLACASTSASASAPPPVSTKTKTRNVYDGTTKVGELTFTVQKHADTSQDMTNNHITLSGTVTFEVTNQDYITDQSPMPQTESIPIAGAEDWSEENDEDSGFMMGTVGPGSKCFFLTSAMQSGHTWNDFFNNPTSQLVMKIYVNWYNNNPHSSSLPDECIAFTVKEETQR